MKYTDPYDFSEFKSLEDFEKNKEEFESYGYLFRHFPTKNWKEVEGYRYKISPEADNKDHIVPAECIKELSDEHTLILNCCVYEDGDLDYVHYRSITIVKTK